MDKNVKLDERQEQVLSKISEKGFWIAFWGLLIVMAIQFVMYGFGEFSYIIGEWSVFMVMALYMVIECTKNGIWDRKYAPTTKNNLIFSLIGGVVFSLIMGMGIAARPGAELLDGVITGGIGGLFVFGICFITLSVMAAKFKKDQTKAEAAAEEEEDEI